MATPIGAGRSLWFPHGIARSQRPVVFFPPAGADQRAAAPLLPHLAGLGVAVVRVPGRGVRSEEPAPTDVVDLVDELAAAVAALDGPPPILVGHSFGGLLAFAVALTLEQRGPAVGALVPVASLDPGGWREVVRREFDDDRPAGSAERRAEYVERRVRRVLELGALPAAVAADPEQRDAAIEQLRVDIGMSVRGMPVGTVSCPVSSVFARDDRLVGPGAAEGWRAATTGTSDTVTVPGDHFFYRTAPALLAGRIRLLVDQLDGFF